MEDERRRKPWEERVRECTDGSYRLMRIVEGAGSAGGKIKLCGWEARGTGPGPTGVGEKRRCWVKIEFKVTVPGDMTEHFISGMRSEHEVISEEGRGGMSISEIGWAHLGCAVGNLQTVCEIKF